MGARSRLSRLRERNSEVLEGYKDRSRLVRVFRHRDFRLMWTGAFLSFIGSWVQNIAQGYLVFELTKSNYLLGLVSFFGMLPVTFLGPIAGTLTDTLNRRRLLVLTQSIYAAGAFFLGCATYYQFVQYWHIVTVALILGVVSAVEMPTRQSIISATVPPEDLPAAIPLNGLTFNLSRLIGPPIGGLLLSAGGPAACYFINAASFFALIFAGLAIKADLRATKKEPQPIGDLIMEGALYTFRDIRLRTLFLLEATVSVFGLFYLTQLPAYVKQVLHGDKRELSIAYTAIGVGAVLSLSFILQLSDKPFKAFMIRLAMTLLAVALILLGVTSNRWAAYALLATLGLCGITQFNTTNTLFQTLSPPHLRGRVLAMHIWALSGLAPFGVLAFGYLAQLWGLSIAFEIGGSVVLIAALWGWIYRKGLEGVENPYEANVA